MKLPAAALTAACALACNGPEPHPSGSPTRPAPASTAPAASTASAPGPTGGPSDLTCARVLAHLRSLLVIELASIPGSMPTLERALAIVDPSCRAGQWPPELRRCILAVPLVGPTGGTTGLTACLPLVPRSLRATLEPSLRAL